MFDTTLPIFAAWANAALLVGASMVHLSGIRGLRQLYAGWEMPTAFYLILAAIELMAAYFLVTPELRIWGIAIAAVIAFGSVVLLLDHEQYFYAVPVVLFMIALVPAALSIPDTHEHIRYTASLVLQFA